MDNSVLNDPDRISLLQQVITNPDDDTVRLVYADRLAELGEEDWAEFIRVQIGLSNANPSVAELVGCLPNRKWEAEEYRQYADWNQRERELVNVLWWSGRKYISNRLSIAHTAGYCPPDYYLFKLFCDGVGFEIGNVDFNRGLVGKLTMKAEDFLKVADTLLWHPKQNDQCPKCVGRGGHIMVTKDQHQSPANAMHSVTYWNQRNDHWRKEVPTEWKKCPNCVAGLISKACPPTAQPIRKVVFTDIPECSLTDVEKQRWWQSNVLSFWGRDIIELYRAEWPFVEFEYAAGVLEPEWNGTAFVGPTLVE